jgi:hypothetical protein
MRRVAELAIGRIEPGGWTGPFGRPEDLLRPAFQIRVLRSKRLPWTRWQMFCTKCGDELAQGTRFCTSCGAPVRVGGGEPKPEQGALLAGPTAPPAQPISPPGSPTSVSAKASDRRLLCSLIVAAAVVVLGGGGTGAYFLLRGGNDGPPVTGSSPTVIQGTISAETGSTQLMTTTIVTLAPTPPVPVATSTTVAQPTSVYLQALGALEQLLPQLDTRIPELATIINADTANIPRSVNDELQNMVNRLDQALSIYQSNSVPAAFSGASSYLLDAVSAMRGRVIATLNGVEEAQSTGTVGTGSSSFFGQGRAYRDAYRNAFQLFQNSLPGE